MKIEKTLEFTLLINDELNGKKGHGVLYKRELESDLAALLISCDVLEDKITSAKAMKKEVSGKMKDLLGSNIFLMSRGLSALNELTNQLLEGYEQFKQQENEGGN